MHDICLLIMRVIAHCITHLSHRWPLHYTGKGQPQRWSNWDTGSAVSLLLQEVMKSAIPAQKLVVNFAHLAKLLNDVHLAASNMSVKVLRAQVGKDCPFTSCLSCKSAVTQVVVQALGPSSTSSMRFLSHAQVSSRASLHGNLHWTWNLYTALSWFPISFWLPELKAL